MIWLFRSKILWLAIFIYQAALRRLIQTFGQEWANKQLILYCFDKEDPSYLAPRGTIVEAALTRVKELAVDNKSPWILTHCYKGRSRSPALDLVFRRYARGPGSEIRMRTKNCCMHASCQAGRNRTIVAHGDKILECEGKLVEAVEKVFGAVPHIPKTSLVCRTFVPPHFNLSSHAKTLDRHESS